MKSGKKENAGKNKKVKTARGRTQRLLKKTARNGSSHFLVEIPCDCLVCSVAIQETVFPSCLCGPAALVSRKVFWLVMGSDGFQTHGCGARSGLKGFWQKQSQSLAGRSGRANSARNRMCG